MQYRFAVIYNPPCINFWEPVFCTEWYVCYWSYNCTLPKAYVHYKLLYASIMYRVVCLLLVVFTFVHFLKHMYKANFCKTFFVYGGRSDMYTVHLFKPVFCARSDRSHLLILLGVQYNRHPVPNILYVQKVVTQCIY